MNCASMGPRPCLDPARGRGHHESCVSDREADGVPVARPHAPRQEALCLRIELWTLRQVAGKPRALWVAGPDVVLSKPCVVSERSPRPVPRRREAEPLFRATAQALDDPRQAEPGSRFWRPGSRSLGTGRGGWFPLAIRTGGPYAAERRAELFERRTWGRRGTAG